MNITGKVVAITPEKVINDKLSTRQVVIGWNRVIKDKSYPQTTAFELKRSGGYDTIKLLNDVKVGDEVKVEYNEPTSREYNGNYYTSVEAWSVKKVGGEQGGSTASNANDSSDLPF